MKSFFTSKILVALAVAVATVGFDNFAGAQPAPPTGSSALPANIPLGSPTGQVLKLVQASVDAGVIMNYIQNCPSAFNLDADQIISLTDAGVTSDMVSAMYAHDKALAAAAPAPVAPSQPAASVTSAGTAATDAQPDLSVAQVTPTLAPYGSWVYVAGYGNCWRPSVVVYDATWRPYCDRGHWVYTDCGWYWDSDYAWGVTFHYGRWFCDANYGWCWWPDTVWAPSWVTWRSGGQYCGWAPLPPFTAYQPGIGFTYRGNNVAVSFGFGLAANSFTFVSAEHFCEPHPRNYCVPSTQVTQVYNQTTIINNYNYNRNSRAIVNNGVSVTVIGNAAHRPIQSVPVRTLVSPEHHSWNNISSGTAHPVRPYGASTTESSPARNVSGTENEHGAAGQNNNASYSRPNTGANAPHNSAAPEQTQNRSYQAAAPADEQQPRIVSPRYSENAAHQHTPYIVPPQAPKNYSQPQNSGNGGKDWAASNH